MKGEDWFITARVRVCLSVHRGGGYPYPIMLCTITQNAMGQTPGGYPYPIIRVATAQGEQGIQKSTFPDRENTGNLLKNIKNMFLHREFATNTGKILRVKKNNELVI